MDPHDREGFREAGREDRASRRDAAARRGGRGARLLSVPALPDFRRAGKTADRIRPADVNASPDAADLAGAETLPATTTPRRSRKRRRSAFRHRAELALFRLGAAGLALLP